MAELIFLVLMVILAGVLSLSVLLQLAAAMDAEEREKKLKAKNLRLEQELEAAKRLIVGLVDKDHDSEIQVLPRRGQNPVWLVKIRGRQVYFPDMSYGEKHELVKAPDLRTWTTPRPPRPRS